MLGATPGQQAQSIADLRIKCFRGCPMSLKYERTAKASIELRYKTEYIETARISLTLRKPSLIRVSRFA